MNEPTLKFYDDGEYEKALQFLLASENHVVHRKTLFPKPSQIKISNLKDCNVYRGVFLDTETTGFSHKDDEGIQICMLPFIYAKGGLVRTSIVRVDSQSSFFTQIYFEFRALILFSRKC